MQFASSMYFLLVSPSGRSLDLQEVYWLIPTHDEHTVAKMLAKASSREQRIICIAILSCYGKYMHYAHVDIVTQQSPILHVMYLHDTCKTYIPCIYICLFYPCKSRTLETYTYSSSNHHVLMQQNIWISWPSKASYIEPIA